MSSRPQDGLRAFLEERRRAFVASLPARLAAIEEEWRAAIVGSGSDEALRRLAFAAHALAGTAPLFGLADLGDAARALQREAEALADRPAGEEALGALGALVARVREKAAA